MECLQVILVAPAVATGVEESVPRATQLYKSAAAAPMNAVLDRKVLHLKELEEQPQAPYVLLFSGVGIIPDVVVTIDAWRVSAAGVIGFRGEGVNRYPIISFPAESSWAVLHRDAFVEMRREDTIRQHAKDVKELERLHSELDSTMATASKKAHRVEERQLNQSPEAVGPEMTHPGNYL